MKETKMPGSAGTHTGRGHNEGRIIKMSTDKIITFFEHRQYRKAVVWLIEAVIGAGIVAATILAASLLLKACGVL